jgi:hypothetical protein
MVSKLKQELQEEGAENKDLKADLKTMTQDR